METIEALEIGMSVKHRQLFALARKQKFLTINDVAHVYVQRGYAKEVVAHFVNKGIIRASEQYGYFHYCGP